MMFAALLENAAVAARLMGQRVPEALMRELSHQPYAGQEQERALRDAVHQVRRANAAADAQEWAVASLDAALARETFTPRALPDASQEASLPARRETAGASDGGTSAGDAYSSIPAAHGARAAQSAPDMAAISRFFERDARRYG